MIVANGIGSSGSFPLVEAGAVVSLGAIGLLYAVGYVRLARRGRRIGLTNLLALYLGLAILLVALVAMAEPAARLLSIHMVQHLILMVVVPPLLIYGRPRIPLLVAATPAVRRAVAKVARWRVVHRTGGVLEHPLLVAIGVAVALWGWHLPALYEAALRSDPVHGLEHLSFLAISLLFWRVVARGSGAQESRRAAALAVVFVTALQSAALGAILTFATAPLYPVHAARTLGSGLAPLEDQQLAGVLMWIPPGIVYLVVMVALLSKWLIETNEPERRPARAGQAP